MVDDDEIIKVHVHTEEPGNALQAALVFGQLLTVKIENMKEQHRKAAEANEEAKAKNTKKVPLTPADPVEEIGFVAVAAGDGLHTLFTDLGCTHVVSGGQTMNPSTQRHYGGCTWQPRQRRYIVLPNNKNIIMAAEQAAELAKDRTVVVVPTRTIPQGIAAMLAFDPELDGEDAVEQMMQAAGKVTTGQVTFAARDSEVRRVYDQEGEILDPETVS